MRPLLHENGGRSVTTQKPKPAMLYASGSPVRWLRAAAAVLDESLATLCANQWQRAQLAVVPVRSGLRENRRRSGSGYLT